MLGMLVSMPFIVCGLHKQLRVHCAVVAADQELQKRRVLGGHGAVHAAIDIRALRAANQIMAAHTQKAAPAAPQTAGS